MEKNTQNKPFAVISLGGKQYVVREGDVVKTEKLASEGGRVSADVLLYDSGTSTDMGAPTTGKKATGEVVSEGRDPKVTVIKYKAKSRYFKKRGHRQPFTTVKITSIG